MGRTTHKAALTYPRELLVPRAATGRDVAQDDLGPLRLEPDDFAGLDAA